MSRKVLAASLLGILLTGSLASVAPAGAATISSGVLCTKAGATAKVGTS